MSARLEEEWGDVTSGNSDRGGAGARIQCGVPQQLVSWMDRHAADRSASMHGMCLGRAARALLGWIQRLKRTLNRNQTAVAQS